MSIAIESQINAFNKNKKLVQNSLFDRFAVTLFAAHCDQVGDKERAKLIKQGIKYAKKNNPPIPMNAHGIERWAKRLDLPKLHQIRNYVDSEIYQHQDKHMMGHLEALIEGMRGNNEALLSTYNDLRWDDTPLIRFDGCFALFLLALHEGRKEDARLYAIQSLVTANQAMDWGIRLVAAVVADLVMTHLDESMWPSCIGKPIEFDHDGKSQWAIPMMVYGDTSLKQYIKENGSADRLSGDMKSKFEACRVDLEPDYYSNGVGYVSTGSIVRNSAENTVNRFEVMSKEILGLILDAVKKRVNRGHYTGITTYGNSIEFKLSPSHLLLPGAYGYMITDYPGLASKLEKGHDGTIEYTVQKVGFANWTTREVKDYKGREMMSFDDFERLIS